MMRVAIIGAGFIARYAHLPAYRAAGDEVQVVAVCDMVERRTQRLAAEFGVPKQYADWREMLRAERPDIVSVCLPNRLHEEVTVACLAAGAHVLCEKPLATSLAEAERMFAAARGAGRKLMSAQHYRFTNSARTLRAAYEAGRFGDVYYGEAIALRRLGIPTWGAFHHKSASAGGALLDIGVHMLDQTLWLMGNPEPMTVSASVQTRFGHRADVAALMGSRWEPETFDVDDFAVALVRFTNGASLSLRASWASHWEFARDRMTSVVLGTEAGATTSPPAFYRYSENGLEDEPIHVGDGDPYAAEVAHFLEVVRGEAEPIVAESQTLDVQRILDACYQSSGEGREVTLAAPAAAA